jgi:3-oxoacyl-[acyl-carrier protein] reductase
MKGISGKTAVVTGGSRGIGRAIVLELLDSGADVVFSYLSDKDAASELETLASKMGRKAIGIQADVRDLQTPKKLAAAAKEKLGRIDLLVNNAGILRDKSLMLMSDLEWNDVIETNLNGLFYLTREIGMMFFKQKSGAIVNVSSTAGIQGSIGQTNYSASKAGVVGFTKALAREVAGYGIRVNAVAPGFIRTDMVNSIPEIKMKEFEKTIPMKRVGLPEEVATVTVFLLSDAASYITGHVFPIDGGLAI